MGVILLPPSPKICWIARSCCRAERTEYYVTTHRRHCPHLCLHFRACRPFHNPAIRISESDIHPYKSDFVKCEKSVWVWDSHFILFFLNPWYLKRNLYFVPPKKLSVHLLYLFQFCPATSSKEFHRSCKTGNSFHNENDKVLSWTAARKIGKEGGLLVQNRRCEE